MLFISIICKYHLNCLNQIEHIYLPKVDELLEYKSNLKL